MFYLFPCEIIKWNIKQVLLVIYYWALIKIIVDFKHFNCLYIFIESVEVMWATGQTDYKKRMLKYIYVNIVACLYLQLL